MITTKSSQEIEKSQTKNKEKYVIYAPSLLKARVAVEKTVCCALPKTELIH